MGAANPSHDPELRRLEYYYERNTERPAPADYALYVARCEAEELEPFSYRGWLCVGPMTLDSMWAAWRYAKRFPFPEVGV